MPKLFSPFHPWKKFFLNLKRIKNKITQIFFLWNVFFFSHSRIKGHVFTDKPWRDYLVKLCFPRQFFSHEHRRENRDQTLKMERQKKSKCSTRPSACPSPDCESDFGLAQDFTKWLEPHVWIISNNDPDLWLVGLISTPSLSRWLCDVSHLLWTRSELRSCRWARRCSPLSQRWGTAAPSSAGSDTDRWARPRQTWGINQWDKLLTSLPFKQHEDDNFISTPPPECEAWKKKTHMVDERGAKTGTLTYLDHGLISVHKSFGSSVQKKKTTEKIFKYVVWLFSKVTRWKNTDPKCEDSILAEANSAAGAEAKNRFSGTECVLIQQLYNHGTWKIPGKHYEHRLVYGWMEARGVLTGQAGEDRYHGGGASLSSECPVERSCL